MSENTPQAVLTRAGFREVQRLDWESMSPYLLAVDPESDQQVLIKTVDPAEAAKLAGGKGAEVEQMMLAFLRGQLRWETRCRKLLGEHIGHQYVREGEVDGLPFVVLEYHESVPLLSLVMARDVRLVEFAPEIGTRMCELCLAAQREKIVVSEYLLSNWLVCDDGRLALRDFPGSQIRNETAVADLIDLPDVKAYHGSIAKQQAEENLRTDRENLVYSFVFMLIDPKHLQNPQGLGSLPVQLAVSQHIINDAQRAGVEVENKVAANYFHRAPESWLVYLVCHALTKKIGGPTQLRRELRPHLAEQDIGSIVALLAQ